MTARKQNDLIDRNGAVFDSDPSSVQQVIDECDRLGVSYRKIDDKTYRMYGWEFGNDWTGFYFFRTGGK